MSRVVPKLSDTFLDEALAAGESDHEFAANALYAPLASIALSAAPVEASADLRARLLATLASTHRFDEFEVRVAALLDVTRDVAAGFLHAIDGPAEAWSPGPRPVVSLLHVEGGPRVANAVTGFVRVGVGDEFPEHGHVGDEIVLVLQGAFQDSDGQIYRAGDEAKMPAGSSHHFRSIGPARLVGLAIVHGGVIVDGHTIDAADPRA